MKLMNKQVLTWFYSQTQITELKIRNGLTSLLGRKAMTNLDSILKRRDVILPTNIHIVKAMVFIVKAMVFPVVTYGCESWSIKKAEC